MVNITNSRIHECVCVCMCVLWVSLRRTVTSPAQHLSSCQGDLHPLPELWSETSQSMEQCGTELRLAGKRPPALYHRRDTGAGCQILVVTGTRPQRFSGESWRRRTDKCVFLCSCLHATLGAYHRICVMFLSRCQCHCFNQNLGALFVHVCEGGVPPICSHQAILI